MVLTPALFQKIKEIAIPGDNMVKQVLNTYLFTSLGCREKGLQEIVFASLHIALVRKSRKIIKVNTLPPNERHRTIKTPLEMSKLPLGSMDIYKDGLTQQESLLKAYMCRPINLIIDSPLVDMELFDNNSEKDKVININWDNMSYSTFLSYFNISNYTSSARSKLTKWKCQDASGNILYHVTLAKKKSVLRTTPYVPIDYANSNSCYSILLLNIPFRKESDLLRGYRDDGVTSVYTPQQSLSSAFHTNLFSESVSRKLESQRIIEAVRREKDERRQEDNNNKSNYNKNDDAGTDSLGDENDMFEHNAGEGSFPLDDAMDGSTPVPSAQSFFVNKSNVDFHQISTRFADQSRKTVREQRLDKIGLGENNKSIYIKTGVDKQPTLNEASLKLLIDRLKISTPGQLELIESIITDLETEVPDIYGAMVPKQILTILSGGGGVGKSHVIETVELLAAALAIRKGGKEAPVCKTAPTGCAAYIIGGGTIQSKLRIFYNNDVMSAPVEQNFKRDFEGVNIFVIDEMSMVSPSLLILIDHRLKTLTGKHLLPFGGVHIILAGDFFQLPPVKALSLCKKIHGNNQEARNIYERFGRYIELNEVTRTNNLQLATANSFLRLGPEVNLTEPECDKIGKEWTAKFRNNKNAIPSNFAESMAFMNARVILKPARIAEVTL